jgi:hypothetical protein
VGGDLRILKKGLFFCSSSFSSEARANKQDCKFIKYDHTKRYVVIVGVYMFSCLRCPIPSTKYMSIMHGGL